MKRLADPSRRSMRTPNPNLEPQKPRTANVMNEPEFVSAREAAHLLGVSDTAIRKRIASGSIEATKVGHAWRIARSEIERLRQRGAQQRTQNQEPRTSGREPRTEHANPNPPQARHLSAEHDPVTQERNTLAIEVEVLRTKLEASEHHAESLRNSFERTQHQLDDALGSVRGLTDEVKGLTAMIHAHKALPSPAGWLQRVVRQLVASRL